MNLSCVLGDKPTRIIECFGKYKVQYRENSLWFGKRTRWRSIQKLVGNINRPVLVDKVFDTLNTAIEAELDYLRLDPNNWKEIGDKNESNT